MHISLFHSKFLLIPNYLFKISFHKTNVFLAINPKANNFSNIKMQQMTLKEIDPWIFFKLHVGQKINYCFNQDIKSITYIYVLKQLVFYSNQIQFGAKT